MTAMHRNTLGSEPYLVEIGDNVYFSGTETRIFTHDGAVMQLYHMGLAPKKMDYFGRVKIGNNCFIAHNVIILKNVEIGDNCIIGAGSVVTRNIPAGSVACGVPARVTGTVENYYMRHKEEFDDTFGWDHARKREYLTMKYSDDKDQ